MAKTEKTQRGFGRIDFIDSYGQECSIQESSNIIPRIWLGVDTDLEKKHVNQRMHLTQEQAKNLLPLIQFFAKNGRLPERFKPI